MSEFLQRPNHIAIVMDGNGRWAKARHKPRVFGHQAGVESVRKVIQACIDNQIPTLSLFAFSSENWNRPALEVSALMELFSRAISKEMQQLHENNVRCEFIGDLTRFSPKLQTMMENAKALTEHNTGLHLLVAVNYGGQWDITQACRNLASAVQSGECQLEDITPERLQANLCTGNLAAPDLFIRTSGEMRISNFYLWQSAYTEFYFTPLYWPEFDENALEQALDEFAKRRRRYGQTDEQLEA